LLVRNTTSGPLVFSVPKDGIALEWQAMGDATGEDYQQVPDELVNNVAFLKNIQRGTLVIEEAPEALQEMIDKQTASFDARTTKAAEAAASAIDQKADNDLITLPCIGPNQRGSGECGQPVPVKERTKWEHPPLCDRHKSLAPQYVMTEGETLVEGRAEKHWHRAGVGGRETQLV
jgi:hypothetical protein